MQNARISGEIGRCMDAASAGKLLHDAIATGETVADGIIRLAGHPLFIYGAGNYGRIIYRLLTMNGISSDAIVGFLDRAAPEDGTLLGLPVRQPQASCISMELRKKVQVVIAIYCSLAEQTAIEESLHDLGYLNVRSGYETAISFSTANDPLTRIIDRDFLRSNLPNIEKGCEYWEDLRSLDTYVNHFIGYAQCDVSRFLLEDDHPQYFPPPPLQRKGWQRFVDCGAYDGDTIRALLRCVGKVQSLALFEPSPQSFQKLAAYVRKNAGNIAEQTVLFPCGVWDRTEQLRFDDSAASASTISDGGAGVVQCVAIDDTLHGFRPTCIKMDIEGAEPQAIEGAERTIKQHRPDLALSVYHSLSHFWEIPELIRHWVPQYRFFLRTYGSAGFETIMYAIVND